MIITVALFTTVDYADTMYSVMCRYNDDYHCCCHCWCDYIGRHCLPRQVVLILFMNADRVLTLICVKLASASMPVGSKITEAPFMTNLLWLCGLLIFGIVCLVTLLIGFVFTHCV